MGTRQYDFDLKAQNSLHLAVVQGHLKVVRYLIDKCGFDPRLPDLVGTYICSLVPSPLPAAIFRPLKMAAGSGLGTRLIHMRACQLTYVKLVT